MIHDILLQHEPVSSDENLRVGACGWQHAHWTGDFYPEDLPLDWRLNYYANEFPVVLLPEREWKNGQAEWQSWLDEVEPGFGFYLQYTQPPDARQQIALSKALGDHLQGFVGAGAGELDKRAGVALVELSTRDMRGWRQWLQQQAGGLRAVFPCDQYLSYRQLSEFRDLVEMLGL